MIVYRYLTLKELTSILNEDFNSIGNFYDKSVSNTHHYKKNMKYLHFFKNLNDIAYIQTIKRKQKNLFLCKFDIPYITILRHRGKGRYETHGYDSDFDVVKEYAIPAKKMKNKYLITYVLDADCNLDTKRAKELLGETPVSAINNDSTISI